MPKNYMRYASTHISLLMRVRVRMRMRIKRERERRCGYLDRWKRQSRLSVNYFFFSFFSYETYHGQPRKSDAKNRLTYFSVMRAFSTKLLTTNTRASWAVALDVPPSPPHLHSLFFHPHQLSRRTFPFVRSFDPQRMVVVIKDLPFHFLPTFSNFFLSK